MKDANIEEITLDLTTDQLDDLVFATAQMFKLSKVSASFISNVDKVVSDKKLELLGMACLNEFIKRSTEVALEKYNFDNKDVN